MKNLRYIRMFFLAITIFQAVAMEVPKLNWHELEQRESIGRGSFGEVHRGRWAGQDVAIKVLYTRTLSAELKRDFDRGADLMWRSQSDRVVRLYGVCTDPGHSAMVLELMNGSLYDLLHSETIIPEKQLWQTAIDIAQGLSDLHNNHILHRDLKSHNIFLDARGRAKIADFGLTKFRLASSTQTHHTGGTMRWCAPELLDLSPPQANTAMDMYSYGVILWELIARKIPFEAQPNDEIVMAAISRGERESIPAECPDVLQGIIEACWQQESTNRPEAKTVLEWLIAAQPEKPELPVWFFEDKSITAIPNSGFVVCSAGQQDWLKVLQCYQHHPIPGYDVGRVDLIYHPDMNRKFAATLKLLQQRKGNPRYAADWPGQGDLRSWRHIINQKFLSMTEPYTDENCPDVKLMPLWYGTQKDKLGSILSAGYTPFDETDDGYFGKGIYMTHEARYAEIYANRCVFEHNPEGVLILNWIASYSSYPIIREDFNASTKKLVSRIASEKYDSHFIPVVSMDISNVNYRPTGIGEESQNTEMVIFDSDKILPRYIITLQPTLPRTPFNQIVVMNTVIEQQAREREEQARRVATVSSPALKIGGSSGGGSAAAAVTVSRPVVAASRLTVPEIARGNEDIYARFMRGVLIYRPTAGSEVGRIDLPIASLLNPLESTFDLSRCGDASQYLSINTGYKKKKISANSGKVEVWIVPKFVVEKDVGSGEILRVFRFHYRDITSKWTAPFGLFYTWGGYEDLTWYDDLVTASSEEISSKNLYENWIDIEQRTWTREEPVVRRARRAAECLCIQF
jgi:serine/threonine protein kinase